MQKLFGVLCGVMLYVGLCFGVFAQSLNNAQTPSQAARDIVAEANAFDQAVFFFGGRFQADYFEYSFLGPFADYENNFVIGGGYQHYFLDLPLNFRFGAEAGLAARLGDGDSLEAWGGVVFRNKGFAIGDVATISPALTFGLSAVTGTIGVETERAADIGRDDVPVLFYLGPEINLTLADHPDMDIFWRVQHRSGAWGTIAEIDGSNANTIGIRWKF
jgi:hypothetical protein